MKCIVLLASFTVSLFTLSAFAQDRPSGLLAVRVFDLAVGYTAIYANAPPPGGCSCFWMNGGNGEIAIADAKRLGLAANFSMTTASNIGINSGHDLALATLMAGPRYSLKERSRFSPYAQILIGAAHSSTNNILDNGKTSFALAVGGGVEMRLKHRFSWRVVQADYLLTHIPNGASNEQNQLRLGSSIVFHVR